MPVQYERKNVMYGWQKLIRGLSFLMGTFATVASAAETWDGKLVQFGKMHEAIGMQQDQGVDGY